MKTARFGISDIIIVAEIVPRNKLTKMINRAIVNFYSSLYPNKF